VNEQQLRAGVPRAAAYDRTMMLLAGLLAVGFICNALIRPLGPADVEPEAVGVAPRPSLPPATSPGAAAATRPANLLLLAGFWLFVAIPMGWGLWATIRQAAALIDAPSRRHVLGHVPADSRLDHREHGPAPSDRVTAKKSSWHEHARAREPRSRHPLESVLATVFEIQGNRMHGESRSSESMG
jgi:hypothetical protein